MGDAFSVPFILSCLRQNIVFSCSEIIRVSLSLFLYFSFLLLLFYVIINFYEKYYFIIISLLFFYEIIFIFSCSAMFRDVQECSRMFRHVPECSVFRVLSTPIDTRLCVNKIYNFHFSAYFKLFATSETRDHPFTLQMRVF